MEKYKGWIKLHRKLWDNPWMHRPNYLAVWIWILTHAEHGLKKVDGEWVVKEEKEMPSIIWKGKRRYLKAGEFTFGAYRIAKDTGVSRGTVERIMKTLKSEEQIEEQASNKFSLGKVNNWNEYQQSEEQNEEQVRNKRGTSEDVTKNVKNEKNEKNNIYMEILGAFNHLTGKEYRMTPDKRAQIKGRLKVFSRDDIVQCIKNRLADPSSMGQNPTGKIWAHDWDSLFRNDKNMDRALQLPGSVLKDNNYYIREMQSLDFHRFRTKYGDELALKYRDYSTT